MNRMPQLEKWQCEHWNPCNERHGSGAQQSEKCKSLMFVQRNPRILMLSFPCVSSLTTLSPIHLCERFNFCILSSIPSHLPQFTMASHKPDPGVTNRCFLNMGFTPLQLSQEQGQSSWDHMVCILTLVHCGL